MSAMDEEKPEFKPWPNQDERGVDLTQIRAMLALTPEERLRYAVEAARKVKPFFGVLRSQ